MVPKILQGRLQQQHSKVQRACTVHCTAPGMKVSQLSVCLPPAHYSCVFMTVKLVGKELLYQEQQKQKQEENQKYIHKALTSCWGGANLISTSEFLDI